MTTTTQLKKTQQDLTKAMEGFDIHCVRQVKGALESSMSHNVSHNSKLTTGKRSSRPLEFKVVDMCRFMPSKITAFR